MVGRSITLGFALLLASVGGAAAEFACAPLKPSATRQPGYARVGDALRCEGFFDRQVSQPFVELLSLTRGPLPRDGAPPLSLAAANGAAVRLVVQPLRPAPFYRVDALVPAGQPLTWDAAPMLAATGLRLRDLGFLAWPAAAPAGDQLVPVLLPGGQPGSPLQAVLRVSVPVSALAWRRLRLDGSDDGSGGWREIPGPARFAWERVPLSLDLPANEAGMRVDVQATDADGKVLPLLRFSVLAAADGRP